MLKWDFCVCLEVFYMILVIASAQIPPGSPTITGPQYFILGSQISLQCSSTGGSPTPALKWFINQQVIKFGVSTTTVGSTTTSTWTFIATKKEHFKVCECQAENGVLQNPLSTTKQIEVHFSPATPTLTGPTNLTSGQSGIWTCTSVNGYPAGVVSMRNQNTNTKFQSGETTFTIYHSGTSNSYDVTRTLTWSPTFLNNESVICCDVSHTTTLGNSSQTVCLRISDVQQTIKIYANATQYYPIQETTVTLHCDVTQGVAVTIKWFKDGSELNINSNPRLSGGTVATESLTITHVDSYDIGNYICQATDAASDDIVSTKTINVTPTGIYWGAPITTIPQTSYTQIRGKQIILNCNVSSPDYILQEVQWRFTNYHGVVTDPILVSISNGKFSGSTKCSPSLTINNLTTTDQGIYSCNARNTVGNSLNNPTTNLTVTGSLPIVEIVLTDYTAAFGNKVIIYCNIVSASPVKDVYWQRSSNNRLLIVYNGDVRYESSTSLKPSLTINFTTLHDAGTYTCHATNDVGTGNSNTGTLTITGGHLSVSVTPHTSNVSKDESQKIFCNVTETPSSASASACITWLFTPAGSTQQSILRTSNRDKYIVDTTQKPYLTILNFHSGDSGTYVCRATNAAGSSSSYPGSILTYISKPITSVEPSQHAAMVHDNSFQIHCNVTATPGAFNWYWTFKPVHGSVETIIKGTNSQEYTIEHSSTNPHLTIRNIALKKTGVYTCHAVNTAGTSDSVNNAYSKHTLTVTGDSTILCVENIDKFDTEWGITAEKTLVTLPCNGNYTGSVSRYCSYGGKWMEPDYSQCMRKTIQNIHAQSAKLLSGKSIYTFVSTILESLENTTSGNNKLTTGDLVTLSAVLNDIARYVTEHPEKLSINQLEVFGSVCNNLLDERNHQSWEELNDQGSSGVTSVVKAITVYNGVFHKVIQGEFAMIIQKENIVTEVGKTISDEITVPDRLKTSLSWITDSAFEIKLKKSSHQDLTGYSSTFYRNVSRFFPKYLMLNGELQSFNESYDVNSIITDFTIESTASSDHTLIIKFDNLLEKYSRPFCGFWDFGISNTVNGAWSIFGSRLVESTDSYTICEYNHTTNFAVLMSPGRTPLSHNFALSLISAVGCGVSILFLVITIIIHYTLWGYVKNDRTKILMNLCVALILSYTIFLAGITRTEIKEVCTAIAIGLHYMFLTDFCLMLAEGIQIVRMVVIVFSTRSIVHWLLPLCWVVPGIIVAISAGVTQFKGYGNSQFCWLTLESNLIWVFIGPALLVILINFAIFIIMIYKMMTSRGIAGKTLREKSRIGLKSICVIVPLFGVTWVLGALSVNDDLVIFQYLFAIFNSLQGFFICLFHCFLNKQVRQGFNHYQRRQNSNRLDSKLSTNSTNTDIKKRTSKNQERYFYSKEEPQKRIKKSISTK